MADPSRQQYFTMNGAVATAAPQWSTVKPGQPVAGNYYPYEWKVEDKKATTTVVKQQPMRNVAMTTVNLSDVKHVTQLQIPQTMTQQNTWAGPGTTVVAGPSGDAGWSTIKWETPTQLVQKPSTVNTAGLHFVSAPATAQMMPATNLTMNVIQGGRKANQIIETFKCELCNQIFASIASLQDHISSIHEAGGNSKKKNKYNPSTLHCEYKYSGVVIGEPIVTHQAIITGGGITLGKDGKPKKEKRRNWQCEVCQNRFTRKDHLQKHVAAVHEKVRPFECPQCSQKFSQKHHLRAHTLARHQEDKAAAKAFACQQCPKRFTRNDHLERHIESVHEKRKSFECTVCQTQFGRKHHLSKHILAVHAKVKPFGCHLCDQSFLQRHHLGAHIMQAHQPPVMEEPDGTKTYICAICSHRFKRKDHLKKHVETVHEKHRAYACQLCDKRFGQKYHLAIHVSAVHEGKKPHGCELCSHRSARKSGLQRHMKTVHNIPPQPGHMQQQQQPVTLTVTQAVNVANQ